MASHKTGGGGIGQPLHWSERERKLWILVLFICSILIYAARSSLSVSIVEMASEFDWNKKTCVSDRRSLSLLRFLLYCVLRLIILIIVGVVDQ